MAVTDAESVPALPRYAAAATIARKLRVGRETTHSGFSPHSVARRAKPTHPVNRQIPFTCTVVGPFAQLAEQPLPVDLALLPPGLYLQYTPAALSVRRSFPWGG